MATKDQISVLIKAYNQFSDVFNKFNSELDKTEKETDNVTKTTKTADNAIGSLFKTASGVGALKVLETALKNIANTGKELELQFKQVNAVSGDLSDNIKNSAMLDTDSFYAPSKMAGAYYEMASAGLETSEMFDTLNPALDFSTATLIDSETAMNAGIATVKSFGMEFSEIPKIFDAFTEAVSSSSLKGSDFTSIMQNAGAVSKLANQDFKELISAAAAMKNAGTQAMDAGTSIKQSLLQLINPSNEAREIIDKLGIEIYNSSGQMKQWSSIVEEFETALAGLTDEEKNNYLATIFGSDGIRAMSTSLNAGSDVLKEYVYNMNNASGTTNEVASLMQDTFAGSLQKAEGNVERLKSGIYDELQPTLKGLVDTLNAVVTWFLELDDSTKSTILFLTGTGGLVVAITSVIAILKSLAAAFNLSAIAAEAFTLATGPIGLIVLGISSVATGLIAWSNAAKKAKNESEQFLNTCVKRLSTLNTEIQTTDNLISKYEELKNKSSLTATEKEKLHDIEVKLAELYPESVNAIDDQNRQYTDQINLVKKLRTEKEKSYKQDLEIAVNEGELQKNNWIQQRDKAKKEYEKYVNDINRTLNVGAFVSDNIDITNEDFIESLILNTPKYSDELEKVANEIPNFDNGIKSFDNPSVIIDYVSSGESQEDIKKLQEKRDKAYQEYLDKKKLVQDWAEKSVELDKMQNSYKYTNPYMSMEEPSQSTDIEETSKILSAYDDRLKNTSHAYKLGQLSLSQYIAELKTIENDYTGYLSDEADKRYSLQENIYSLEKSLREQGITDKKESLEAYIQGIEQYTESAMTQVNALEVQLSFINAKNSFLGSTFDVANTSSYNNYFDGLTNMVEAYKEKQVELAEANIVLRQKQTELQDVIAENIKLYGANSDRVIELKKELTDLTQQINKNSLAWMDSEQNIHSVADEMENAKNAMVEYSKEMEEAIVDSFSSAYNSKLTAELEKIDSAIAGYNKDLDELNRRYAQEDYLADEEKRQKEISELQAKYNKLRKDDSQWSAKQRNDIAEQIAELEEEQQKAQTEYQREQEKQRIEDKIDSLEQQKEDVQEKYEELLNNIQKIFEEETSQIPELLSEYEDRYYEVGKALGESYVAGIQSQIDKAQKAWEELNAGATNTNSGIGGNSGNISTNDNSKRISVIGPLVNVENMTSNSQDENISNSNQLGNVVEDSLYSLD